MNNRSDKWYADGLHFSCTQCGNCCTGDPGVVWVDESELKAIAEYLDRSIGEVRLFHTRIFGGRVSLQEYPNGDCTFFDGESRRCTVYPVRPKQCQTWPFWQSNLESPEAWKEVQRSCPGAGHGNFVPLEEIESLADAIDM